MKRMLRGGMDEIDDESLMFMCNENWHCVESTYAALSSGLEGMRRGFSDMDRLHIASKTHQDFTTRNIFTSIFICSQCN